MFKVTLKNFNDSQIPINSFKELVWDQYLTYKIFNIGSPFGFTLKLNNILGFQYFFLRTQLVWE